MTENNFSHTNKVTPPPRALLPVLQKVKTVYILWYSYYRELPKAHRYTLGSRLDTLFIEIIEAIATAGFLQPKEKQPYVRLATRKVDTLKVLLLVLWFLNVLFSEQELIANTATARNLRKAQVKNTQTPKTCGCGNFSIKLPAFTGSIIA